MRLRLLFLLFVLPSLGYGQELHFSAAASAPEKIYNKQFDKDTYYIRLIPVTAIKGLAVIIPGLFDGPASSLTSQIPNGLLKNGFVVMIPILSKDNEAFKLAVKDMDNLNRMILDVKTKNKLANDIPVTIGGYSLGGTVALKFYTENQAGRLLYQLSPITNVFAIDPPLDLRQLRKTLVKSKDKYTLAVMDSSLHYFLNRKAKLKRLSVYYPGKKQALPSFSATQLRIYSEPDINWWIDQRNMDLYDMNILGISAYINTLHQNKQNKVQLILTSNKGYRDIGGGKTERHPHAWSIADPADLIKWILAGK